MRYHIWIPTLLLLSTGCSSTGGMNNTGTDAVVGGGLGALLGAIVAGPRHALAGAAIGGGAGALTGAAVGSNQDRADNRRNADIQAAVNAQAAKQMQLTDVVQLSQSKTPDQIIINQINATGSVFQLKAEDIMYLRQQGVSDPVIAVMQTPRPTTVIVQPRRYYYDPPPPPPYGGGVVVIGR